MRAQVLRQARPHVLGRRVHRVPGPRLSAVRVVARQAAEPAARVALQLAVVGVGAVTLKTANP